MSSSSSKFCFDLTKHPMGEKDEKFLAHLLHLTASKDSTHTTWQFMLKARDDFKWGEQGLGWLCELGLLSHSSYRPVLSLKEGESEFNIPLISTAEWMMGVFNVGSELNAEHVRIHVSFVSPFNPLNKGIDVPYQSGKVAWQNAPPSLRELLNQMDDAALARQPMSIVLPEDEAKIVINDNTSCNS